MQWLSAFRNAIDFSGSEIRFQRQRLENRRLARQEEKDKEDGEAEAETSDIGHQLEVEREARANAEEKAATLVRQREVEGKKMKELEKIREQLESLLQEVREQSKVNGLADNFNFVYLGETGQEGRGDREDPAGQDPERGVGEEGDPRAAAGRTEGSSGG